VIISKSETITLKKCKLQFNGFVAPLFLKRRGAILPGKDVFVDNIEK
jgi:hypothetical protein